MSIAYFVHELADAAVQKRLRMLRSAGEDVRLLGFERDRGAEQAHDGIVLGRTQNGRFAARIVSVLLALPRALQRREWRDARLIIARNLEMLALVIALTRFAGKRPRIAYECLDIHRMVLGSGLTARVMRAVERFCLRRVDVVVVSSPAFERNYFRALQHFAGRVLIAENKVLGVAPVAMQGPPPGTPWVIAWCGVLRCARSLDILASVAAANSGLIHVELWGAPALDQIPDFHARVAAAPNLHFKGRYRPDDLAGVYARAHFAWAVDFYEAGGNSDWLLPNRLYESVCFGATPIAAAGVETANWLRDHKVGVMLDAPFEQSLAAFLRTLDAAAYQSLRAAATGLDRDATQLSEASCRAFVAELEGAPA
ncbi:MAG: glycosyltransferase [Terricaulis sp.]